MVIESIREFNGAVPFVPYEIQMASGERYFIPHPDFVAVSPKGNFVVVVEMNGRPHHLSTILIERASPRKRPRARGKRS